jgi:hypothetical protein
MVRGLFGGRGFGEALHMTLLILVLACPCSLVMAAGGQPGSELTALGQTGLFFLFVLLFQLLSIRLDSGYRGS